MVKDQEIISEVFKGKTYKDLEVPDDCLRKEYQHALTSWAKEQEDPVLTLRANAIATDLSLYHSSYHNNPYRKDLQDLSYLEAAKEKGVEASLWKKGFLVIEGSFVYAIRSGKWRKVGKRKWYRSKSLEQLIDNYIK